ncbi:MAG: hypothetical protein EZS28_036170, partial [Streblomastix strix]
MTTQNELSEVVADCAETNNPPIFPAQEGDTELAINKEHDYLTVDNNIQMDVEPYGNHHACPEDVNEDQKQVKLNSSPNIAVQSLPSSCPSIVQTSSSVPLINNIQSTYSILPQNIQNLYPAQYRKEKFEILAEYQIQWVGRTFLAKMKDQSGREFVWERISYTTYKMKKIADEEVKQLILSQGRYIVKLIDVFLIDDCLCIFQEFYSNGNLRKQIEKMNTWNLLQRVIVFIHSLNIIHQDLNPESIYIDKDGIIKIENFGLTLRLAGEY